jgi:hypothetical protein
VSVLNQAFGRSGGFLSPMAISSAASVAQSPLPWLVGLSKVVTGFSRTVSVPDGGGARALPLLSGLSLMLFAMRSARPIPAIRSKARQILAGNAISLLALSLFRADFLDLRGVLGAMALR